MEGINVTVMRDGEFIDEAIYLLSSRDEAIKRYKQRHPEWKSEGFNISAKRYDTEKCKMHYQMCCERGAVFFYNAVG